MFEVPVLAMLLGGLLLLIGIVGGGFEVRELRIPRVATLPRVISAVLGLSLAYLGMNPPASGSGPQLATTDPGMAATAAFVAPAATTAPPAAETTIPAASVESADLQEIQTLPGDEHLEMVRARLDLAAAYWSEQGYGIVASDEGMLAAAGEEIFNVDVLAGEEYAFIAFCDDDCNDVDLEVEDGSGTLIGSDYAVDANPVVPVTALATDRYAITVRVIHCSVEPCRFSIGVFQR